MSAMFLNLSSVPQTNSQGVKVEENHYLKVPQGTTTEEFTEYLKKYEPDVFVALEKIDNKLKNIPTPQNDKEMLFSSPARVMKSVNPQVIKKGLQRFETFILNKTKRPPRVTVDELEERYEKGKEIINEAMNNKSELV